MRHFFTILSHEIRMLLVSPSTYIAGVLFLAVMGFMFTALLEKFSAGPMEVSPAAAFFQFFPLPVLFMVPLLTMKSISEERRNGTMETLLTTPVTTFEVVFERPDGRLTEGSFTSLFVERGGRLVTPPAARGLLTGILYVRHARRHPAPLLDLALFTDLAQRAGLSGVQEWLSFYYKSPMTAPGLYAENDLFVQGMKLKNMLRWMKGETLLTHLGHEYYD